jgi:hypothetical protein
MIDLLAGMAIVTDHDFEVALVEAAGAGRPRSVAALLRHGADPNAEPAPAHHSALGEVLMSYSWPTVVDERRDRLRDILRLLRAYGADMHRCDPSPYSPVADVERGRVCREILAALDTQEGSAPRPAPARSPTR